MARTSPTRVDHDLFASAQLVGSMMDRSAAQQITHWARVGREVEGAPSVSYRAISKVLANQGAYDDLTAEEQAVVRAEWGERMDALRQDLNLAERFRQAHRSYVELDAEGRVVVREPAERLPRDSR